MEKIVMNGFRDNKNETKYAMGPSGVKDKIKI